MKSAAGSSAIGSAIISTIAAAARGDRGARVSSSIPQATRNSGRQVSIRESGLEAAETASNTTFSPAGKRGGQRRNILEEVKGKAADAAKGILAQIVQQQAGGSSAAGQHGGAGSAIKTAVAQMASVAMSAAASVGDAEEDGPTTTNRRNARSNRVRPALHPGAFVDHSARLRS